MANDNNRVTVAILGEKVDTLVKQFDGFEKKLDRISKDIHILDIDMADTKNLKQRVNTLSSRLWWFVSVFALSVMGTGIYFYRQAIIIKSLTP